MKRWFANHANEALVILYFLICYSTFVYLVNFRFYEIENAKVVLVMLVAIVLVLLVIFIPPLMRAVSKIRVGRECKVTRKQLAAAFLIGFLLTFLVLFICWFSSQPGFSPDNRNQYEQAISGVFNDWHPVWHTLLTFWLPLKLTGTVAGMYLFQIICVSLVVAFLVMTLYEFASVRFAAISWAYIISNPFVLYLCSMCLWKDVAFSMAATVAGVLAVRIFISEKDWSREPIALVVLGISLANATIFRHNGILFTGFLLIALGFVIGKKKLFIVAVSFVLFLGVIKGPVYHGLDVQQPDKRVVETMGLPMTIIGNVVSNRPDVLDDELKDFAYAIAPKEIWEESYVTGSYNSIKFDLGDNSIIEETGRTGILRLMLKCIKLAPAEGLQGFLALAKIVYISEAPEVINEYAFVKCEPGRAFYDLRACLNDVLKEYVAFYNLTILSYFQHVGVGLILMFTVMMSKCSLLKWQDWKKLLVVLSIFCYNFGTMLLLTGPDFRFFCITYFICPVFILLLLHGSTKNVDNLLHKSEH